MTIATGQTILAADILAIQNAGTVETARALAAEGALAAEVAAIGSLNIASGTITGTGITLHTAGGSTIALTGTLSSGGGGSSTTPVTVVATSGSAQAISFPASGDACFDITQTANCVISLTGGTAGQYQTISLILRQNVTAGWTATLPSGIKWPGGVAPTLNTLAGKIDVLTISTSDAGVTLFGSY